MIKKHEETPSRAETRHQLERAKKKAFVIAKLNAYPDFRESQARQQERILENARHLYRNRASCSCASCCNTRRSPHYKGKAKLTMQERVAVDLTEFHLG